MQEIYKDYLFEKHILISDGDREEGEMPWEEMKM